MTRNRAGFQLFLNGHLQFSSVDEYRYHEALVHPAFAAAPRARRVAVLGGGDGLAVREILKHPEVESVTLVDLDPAMTRLAATHPLFLALNGGSLTSPKVKVVNEDAMIWIEKEPDLFDVVVIDFPDPNSYAVGQALHVALLLAREEEARSRGRRRRAVHVSPLRAPQLLDRGRDPRGRRLLDAPVSHRRAFVRRLGLRPRVAERRERRRRACPKGLRALSKELLPSLFVFGPDVARIDDVPVNRLNDQVLVRTYEGEWKRFD